MSFLDKIADTLEKVKKGVGALRDVDDLAKNLSPETDKDGPDDTDEEKEEREDNAP